MTFLSPEFQLHRPLVPDLYTRKEDRPIYVYAARRVLSEYSTHTPGSLLKFDLLPWAES